MFLGQYAAAIAAADELVETMPEAILRIPSPPMADFFESYVSIRQHVLVRFGKWQEIIAQDLPTDRDLYCNTMAMIHYAKGVAHAALGDVPAAEAEQALFREAAKRVPRSRQMWPVGKSRHVRPDGPHVADWRAARIECFPLCPESPWCLGPASSPLLFAGAAPVAVSFAVAELRLVKYRGAPLILLY
jgi:hypothetical protein